MVSAVRSALDTRADIATRNLPEGIMMATVHANYIIPVGVRYVIYHELARSLQDGGMGALFTVWDE
jgi:hypothetical protein